MAVLMFWVNWRFAFATLSISPLMFWIVYRHKLLIKRATRRARASTGLLAALAQETLASIRIVQGLAQEDQIDDRFQAQSETTLEAFLESVRYQARIAPVVDCLSRSEEHTSELQSRLHLVCRLLLEKKNPANVNDPVTHISIPLADGSP